MNKLAYMQGYLEKGAALSKEDIVKLLKEHGHKDMGVFGGAAMVLRNLRPETQDIDTEALEPAFSKIRKKYGSPELVTSKLGDPSFLIPNTPISVYRSMEKGYGTIPGIAPRVATEKALLDFYLQMNREKDQPWIKLLKERLANNIDFPENELASLTGRLKAGKTIGTTRISDEKGKYRPGDVLSSKLGALRVKAVMAGKGLKEHPYLQELTEDQKRQIGGWPFDYVELEKTSNDPYNPVITNQMTGAKGANHSALLGFLGKKDKKPRRRSAYAATP